MKKKDYEDFYETVIDPCINDIIILATDEVNNSSVVQPKKNIKQKIFRFYQNKRNSIVSNYMKKKSPVALDRHKVAACMVYAILKANPLKINRLHEKLPEKILLANEYLSFYIALNILEMYKLDALSTTEDEGQDIDYQILQPLTTYEDEYPENTFDSYLCRALYYIKIDNINKFDVFAYANIFFLIEKYTDINRLLND